MAEVIRHGGRIIKLWFIQLLHHIRHVVLFSTLFYGAAYPWEHFLHSGAESFASQGVNQRVGTRSGECQPGERGEEFGWDVYGAGLKEGDNTVRAPDDDQDENLKSSTKTISLYHF